MKDEKLTQKELDQVSGGNMLESMYDSSYLKFYDRVGIKCVDAPWLEHNAYKWNGKQYNSRSALFEALDKAGIKPIRVNVRVPDDRRSGITSETYYE